MTILFIGIGLLTILAGAALWAASDYLACNSCNSRKCFLIGHDVTCYGMSSDVANGKTTLICRRCTKSIVVKESNFVPMFMYYSTGYLMRHYIWKKWDAAGMKNPFDLKEYDEAKIF